MDKEFNDYQKLLVVEINGLIVDVGVNIIR